MRLLALALCFLAGDALAKDFTKTARSGQSTHMATYRSWGKDCSSRYGMVKVIAKPAHGTLRPSDVAATIGTSRRNPERTAHCKGAPTTGFRVDYTSSPGFRGIDTFTIEFTFGRNVDVDSYTVTVE
jgi:hypothetical protein